MAGDYRIMQGSSHKANRSRSLTAGEKLDVRLDAFGNVGVAEVLKPRALSCVAGEYFLATNPTPGTGVASIAAADGVDDTEAYFYLRNANSVASKKQIILDRLSIWVKVAGLNGTTTDFVSKIDSGSDRYTSGGSTITPVNTNMGSSESSGAVLKAGAVVLGAASSAARLLDHGHIRTVIAVAGDRYNFDFGGESPPSAGLATAGTAQLERTMAMAPVVLDPEDAWYFQINGASQDTAAQYEFRLSWFER